MSQNKQAPRIVRAAAVTIAAAGSFHAFAAGTDAPFIYLHGAKPASDIEILPDGWAAQRWAWNDGDGSRCIIAKGHGKPSLNLSLEDGATQITVWDGGALTRGLDPDASGVTVSMNFDGKVPIDAEDVSWEYGVLSYEGSDAAAVAFMLAKSMVVTIAEHDGSLTFDLTGFDEAMKNLISCVLK